MRTALIRALCAATRVLPPLYLDKLAQRLLPRDTTFPDEVIAWLPGIRLVTNWRNSHEWDIYRHGLFELHIRDVIQQYTPRGGRAIDIGANIGLHTLVLSQQVGLDGQVLAFEPNPTVRQRLEANLALNLFTANVQVCPAAASDHAGEAELHVPSGQNITGKASLEALAGDFQLVRVPLTTVDQVIAEQGWDRVDLIKCDVEGHDLVALQGAQHTLAIYHPALLIEYEPSLWQQAGHTYEELFTYLSDLGYRLWRVSPYKFRGLQRSPRLLLGPAVPDALRGGKIDILAIL
jgi:FkbM family methyltransferase